MNETRQRIKQIITKVLAEGTKIEVGELDDMDADEPVTVGVAVTQKVKGSTGRGSPKWRFIKTTAGKAHSVLGKARKSPGFYDSSVSLGH